MLDQLKSGKAEKADAPQKDGDTDHLMDADELQTRRRLSKR